MILRFHVRLKMSSEWSWCSPVAEYVTTRKRIKRKIIYFIFYPVFRRTFVYIHTCLLIKSSHGLSTHNSIFIYYEVRSSYPQCFIDKHFLITPFKYVTYPTFIWLSFFWLLLPYFHFPSGSRGPDISFGFSFSRYCSS